MTTSEAAILLKDVQGEKSQGKIGGLFKSSIKSVYRGELLLLLPRVKVIPRKDNKPAHNFQLANDPSVTLFCPEDDVAPLSDYEYNLMVAIKSREARYDVFRIDLLDWGSKLKEGNFVYATLPSKSPVSNQRAVSVIRYVGPLPKEDGILFGVEIQVGVYISSVLCVCDDCCCIRKNNTDPMVALMVSLVVNSTLHVMRTRLCFCLLTDSHQWSLYSRIPHSLSSLHQPTHKDSTL